MSACFPLVSAVVNVHHGGAERLVPVGTGRHAAPLSVRTCGTPDAGPLLRLAEDPYGYGIVHASQFAVQLAWWLAFFPPEQIHPVFFHDIDDPYKRAPVRSHVLLWAHVWHSTVPDSVGIDPAMEGVEANAPLAR